ncbi:unnamed protein product [Soboliphyme baturini]|uniref:Hexosyltransferase n=1 Tax=Soboliphyme baturini TaxID=241478 RepID=A0A183JB55_9BILA|nr:unnamed protein product [Soboliphyme baturini]
MQILFHNNNSGHLAYSGRLDVPEVYRAITLHPLKDPATMRRMHLFLLEEELKQLRFRLLLLSRDVLVSLENLGTIGNFPNAKELMKGMLHERCPHSMRGILL